MLCSMCNKNTAVVFMNKPTAGNPNKMEGLCYDCAKKRGINPFDALVKQANLSEEELEGMSKQFENMFKDISEQLDNVDPGDLSMAENGELDGASLGSIFSGLFGSNSENKSNSTNFSADNDKKKNKGREKN